MSGEDFKKLTPLLVIIISLSLLSSVYAGETLKIWVSPSGSDASSGTFEDPYRTLSRARDAVRSFKNSLYDNLEVNLMGGVFRLDEPLLLSGHDSGDEGQTVIWRAAPGHEPVVSGSIQVKGWQPHPVYNNVYVAEVSPGLNSRQLFVNKRRCTRASTQSYPAGFLPHKDQGILYEKTGYNDPAWADPVKWDNKDEIDAVLITQWKIMICGVESVQETEQGAGVLKMKEPAWSNASSFYQQDLLCPDAYVPGMWGFWQVTRFENSVSFIDEPGEWAMDSGAGLIYYMPLAGEDMGTAEVELPVLETLVKGWGEPGLPLENIRFEGITFRHATWLRPSGGEGYVADQSGVTLVGSNRSNLVGHVQPNTIGDAERLARTPGNISFRYSGNITIRNCIFEGLGAVALDLATGCRSITVSDNRFEDISSSAVQVGGVGEIDHHPPSEAFRTIDNTIYNNFIHKTGRDYLDSAAIFIGCAEHTVVQNNTIDDCPWSGIAVGWGWGLIDPGSFSGLPGAWPGMWGFFDTPAATRRNVIASNKIVNFLQSLWDGGAVYTTGAQGDSAFTGTLIFGNLAMDKRPDAGGNTFYTDGGSRYVTVAANVSFNNPPGKMYFGPPPKEGAPLPYSFLPSLANGQPYGQDIGGCRTRGDIYYLWNYWQYDDFYNVCPYTDENGVSYPHNLVYENNAVISSLEEVPEYIIRNAGFSENK